MDMSNKDKLEVEKRNEETVSYYPPGMASEWQYSVGGFGNSSMGLVLNGNPMAICGDVVGPSCSTTSMVDLFGQMVWEHPVNAAALGFAEMNVANGSSGSDPLSMLKNGLLLPNMSGMLPHSLSQFPADSAFIERAARFSSFSGGHFTDMLNPFGIQQSAIPYARPGTMMQVPQEIVAGNAMKPVPSRQPETTESNIAETSKGFSLPPQRGDMEGSPPKNEKAVERFHDEMKQTVSVSGNDSDEPGFSGGCAQEDGTPSSVKGIGSKRRKRGNQAAERGQAKEVQQLSGGVGKNDSGTSEMGDPKSTPSGNKSNGKNGKLNSQASDPLKEEYIHVRARRGQATNSHSLAERVRREKISERMKFLQDLVPGCSKVTGKAVMLDEIINYVQSLQRQVEFLSMKLATVNPRLDFNIERLFTKDMFSPRTGPSSGLGFSPEISMPYPPLQSTQPSIFQPGFPSITMNNPSDALRRTITSQMMNVAGAYKESTPQLPNAWDDELHNVVHMDFNASAPIENQETNTSSGQLKAES